MHLDLDVETTGQVGKIHTHAHTYPRHARTHLDLEVEAVGEEEPQGGVRGEVGARFHLLAGFFVCVCFFFGGGGGWLVCSCLCV